MKTFRLRFLFAVVPLATIGLTQTQPARTSPSPPAASSPAATAGEFAALEQFLALSDAALAEMEQVIARVRAMSAAERQALRDQMAAFCRMPEAQRLQMRRGWGAMPPEFHTAWREMMHSAADERRAEIQARMQSLPPDELLPFRRKLVEAYLKDKAAPVPSK